MSRGFGRVRCSCHSPIPPVTPSADFGEAMAASAARFGRSTSLASTFPTVMVLCCGLSGGLRPSTRDGTTRVLIPRHDTSRRIRAVRLHHSWRLPKDPGQMGSGSERASSRSFSPTHLFEDRFGRPGKGNDKGKVEGLVGFIRRNFLVPVPRAESFAALNDALAERVPPAPGGAAAGPQGDHRRA